MPERSVQAFAVCPSATDDSWVALEICATLALICSVALDCSVAAVAICAIMPPTSSLPF